MELLGINEIKIACRKQREQIEPDIRRRGAHGGALLRRNLIIIGRQEIRFLRDMSRKEAPHIPRIGADGIFAFFAPALFLGQTF